MEDAGPGLFLIGIGVILIGTAMIIAAFIAGGEYAGFYDEDSIFCKEGQRVVISEEEIACKGIYLTPTPIGTRTP